MLSIKIIYGITMTTIFLAFIPMIVVWGVLTYSGVVRDDAEPASLFALLVFAFFWNVFLSSVVVFLIYLARLIGKFNSKI